VPPVHYDAWCKTDILASETFTYVWTISNFSSMTEQTGEYLNSEEFTINGPGNKITTWYGQVSPRGQKEEYKNFVSVFLCINENGTEDVFAKCFVSFLDKNDSKQELFEVDVRKFTFEGWGQPKAFPRTKISQYTQDDTLTLIYDITVIGKANKSTKLFDCGEKNVALSQNYHCNQLTHDLDALFNTKHNSDVTVSCGDKEFYCHKNILTSRSSVFKTMLESNMKEKESGRIEIKDMKIEVLEDMLRYIYTSDAPNIDNHPDELFAAAHQYELGRLREMCEVKLCSKLEVANCLNLMVLGELYQALTLKTAALKFVSKNIHQIDTSEWKKTLTSYPALLAEVLEMMMPPKNDSTLEDEKKRAAFS